MEVQATKGGQIVEMKIEQKENIYIVHHSLMTKVTISSGNYKNIHIRWEKLEMSSVC